MAENEQARKQYWRKIVLYFVGLIGSWAVFMVLIRIFMGEVGAEQSPGTFSLSFWLVNQGVMYGFVIVIVVFLYLVNKLDRKYKRDRQDYQ